jgi:uncharacterized Zn finger protein (UPF0148 family)
MSNGKSSSEGGNIKSAADLLLKGGTLLSNSCENCGGVQVRFKENIICANCGRKIKELNVTQIEEEKKKKKITSNNNNNNNSNSGLSQEIKVQSTVDNSRDVKLTSYKRVIYKKITLLIGSLENDGDDILVQNAKLDLVSKYLDIFEKIKVIDKESQ